MRRVAALMTLPLTLAALLALLLILVGCAPAFTPNPGKLEGTTLTSEPAPGYTLYTLTTEAPLERVLLRFPGAGLKTNSDDCTVKTASLECAIHGVASHYTLAVSGVVEKPPNGLLGLVCTAHADCYELKLE